MGIINKRELIYNVMCESHDKVFDCQNWNCLTFVNNCVFSYKNINFIDFINQKDYVLNNWHNDFKIAYTAFLKIAFKYFKKVKEPQTGDIVLIKTDNSFAFGIWYDGFCFAVSRKKGIVAVKDFLKAWTVL